MHAYTGPTLCRAFQCSRYQRMELPGRQSPACNVKKHGNDRNTLCSSFPLRISLTWRSDYRLGRNIARTYLDYYRAIGVIPANLPCNVSTSPEPRIRFRSSRSPSAYPRSRPRTTRGQAELHLHELTAAAHRSGSSSSDGGDGSPVRLAPPSFQHNRGRSAVLLHYRQIPDHTQESTLSAGLRNLAGRKIGGGGTVCHSAVSTAPRPQPQPPAPPRLTIIDFNKLTRGGLDQATGRGHGRGRGRGRGRPKRRDSRKHGGSPAVNRL